MELLLLQLSAKAEMLTEALTTEAQFGRKAIGANTGNLACLSQIQETRQAVEQAQEEYNGALSALPRVPALPLLPCAPGLPSVALLSWLIRQRDYAWPGWSPP